MSHLIDFYAGNARALCRAFEKGDAKTLEAASPHLDLSLQLSLGDIDALSRAALAVAGLAPAPLFKKPIYSFVGPDAESGAYAIDRAWVSGVAGIPPAKAKVLAAEWAKVADSGFKPTKDIVGAVTDLLKLCQHAHDKRLDVVFTWSL